MGKKSLARPKFNQLGEYRENDRLNLAIVPTPAATGGGTVPMTLFPEWLFPFSLLPYCSISR